MPRRRRTSINTILGITQAKRKIARATGIPTTKSGRRRKLKNTLTGGAYGRNERARARRNRMMRTGGVGCCVYVLGIVALIALMILWLF